jgi:hypothetical protein
MTLASTLVNEGTTSRSLVVTSLVDLVTAAFAPSCNSGAPWPSVFLVEPQASECEKHRSCRRNAFGVVYVLCVCVCVCVCVRWVDNKNRRGTSQMNLFPTLHRTKNQVCTSYELGMAHWWIHGRRMGQGFTRISGAIHVQLRDSHGQLYPRSVNRGNVRGVGALGNDG